MPQGVDAPSPASAFRWLKLLILFFFLSSSRFTANFAKYAFIWAYSDSDALLLLSLSSSSFSFFFVVVIVFLSVFPFPNRAADDSIEFDRCVLTGPSGPNTATQRNKVTESKRKNVSGDFRSSFANRGFILRGKAERESCVSSRKSGDFRLKWGAVSVVRFGHPKQFATF